MNLTDGATFPMPLIKCAKIRVNQKIIFPRETKRRIQEIAINNGWNTQIVHILREIRDGKFLYKGNFLSIIPKAVEQTNKWINTNFKYQEPESYYRLFYESEN